MRLPNSLAGQANAYLRSQRDFQASCTGGVLGAATDPWLQIDTTQHQMHAVLLEEMADSHHLLRNLSQAVSFYGQALDLRGKLAGTSPSNAEAIVVMRLRRKIVQIAEVQGMEGDTIVMQDIFQFVQTTVENGKVQGYFTGTGIRPKFMDKIESYGIYLSPAIFAPKAKR